MYSSCSWLKLQIFSLMTEYDRECRLTTWSSKLVNNTSLWLSFYRLWFILMIGFYIKWNILYCFIPWQRILILSWRMCTDNATCNHATHRSVDQWFDHILVHQSNLHFTFEFTIFSGFRVTVVSRHARTSFLITVLKEWWLT
jgi:membrane associated rhomboid family serine protease